MLNNLKLNVARKGDEFVGIKFDGDVCNVFFPIGYNLPDENNDDEVKKSFISLVNTLSLTKAIDKEKIEFNKTNDSADGNSTYSYFWLINDYLVNGLYTDLENKYIQKSNGKINWKKTINLTKPVFSNNQFIYLNPYYSKSINSTTDIAEIEKYCLSLCINLFGWYFGNISIEKSKYNKNQTEYMVNTLINEFNKTFIDSKKVKLQHMINILNGIKYDPDNSNIFSYGTDDYDAVWEKLIQSEFGNENVEEFYTTSSWHLFDDKKEIKMSPLRPDVIYHDSINDYWFVLDAKYYGFSMNDNHDFHGLPSTADVEKQITYAQHIEVSKNIDKNRIYNALILPFNSLNNKFSKNSYDKIIYLGYSTSEWIKDVHYDKVLLILADTTYIIDKWHSDNNEHLSILIDTIKSNYNNK